MKKQGLWILLCVFVFGYVVSIKPVKSYRKNFRKTNPVLYLPPTDLLVVFTLDYRNIISEFLLFRASIYNGERLADNTTPDWHWFYKMMDASIALDPYNKDTYYVTQAQLPWEAEMVMETNALLEKGLGKRFWDWELPFYIAFNYFYFLKDNKTAAQYFSKAAIIEPRLTPLAGKYFQRAREAESGLVFLKYMLNQTDDKGTIKRIEQRITALENIMTLEDAVNKFHADKGRIPESIETLVTEGFIKEVPVLPRRKFYLTEDGRVNLEVVRK